MRIAVTFPYLPRLAIDMSLKDFTHKVLCCQNKLYRFALRMLGSAQEAEDIVQEVMLQMWDRRQDISNLNNVEAWCMRIVKNRSLDALKARRNQKHAQVEEEVLAEYTPDPQRQAEVSDTMEIMHKLIGQLPEKQRMLIHLREVEGHSYQEIAQIMDISLSQVKVNLFRARNNLKEKLLYLESFGTQYPVKS